MAVQHTVVWDAKTTNPKPRLCCVWGSWIQKQQRESVKGMNCDFAGNAIGGRGERGERERAPTTITTQSSSSPNCFQNSRNSSWPTALDTPPTNSLRGLNSSSWRRPCGSFGGFGAKVIVDERFTVKADLKLLYLATESFLRIHSSEANRNHPFASQHISVHQSPDTTTNYLYPNQSWLYCPSWWWVGVCLLHISSAQTGAGGQTCGIDEASSQCPLHSSGFSSYTDFSVECDADYDCCYCQAILCEDCETFKIDVYKKGNLLNLATWRG